MYRLPKNPYEKPTKVTRLLDVSHEAQKASTALALNVPYTPICDRLCKCEAANCLDHQISVNTVLSDKVRVSR